MLYDVRLLSGLQRWVHYLILLVSIYLFLVKKTIYVCDDIKLQRPPADLDSFRHCWAVHCHVFLHWYRGSKNHSKVWTGNYLSDANFLCATPDKERKPNIGLFFKQSGTFITHLQLCFILVFPDYHTIFPLMAHFDLFFARYLANNSIFRLELLLFFKKIISTSNWKSRFEFKWMRQKTECKWPAD